MKTSKPQLKKGDPIPVRFDAAERAEIKKFTNSIPMPASAFIRIAVKYALPKFRSGKVNLATISKL